MKINPTRIVLFFIGVLCCNPAFASNNPPPPIPPPPPGLPIDEGVILLVFVSMILAFYKLYYTKKVSN
jgi:hypothetical protein